MQHPVLQTETQAPIVRAAWDMLSQLSAMIALMMSGTAAELRTALNQMKLAEAFLRRLIYLHMLDMPAQGAPVAKSAPAPGATRPKPPSGTSGAAFRTPKFQLIEPWMVHRTAGHIPPLPEALAPRITLMDAAARPGIPPALPTAARAPAARSLETRLLVRFIALQDAFVSIDDHARRLGRWIARQAAENAPRRSPLSAGPPPGFSLARSDEDSVALLFDFHNHVTTRAASDTS